MREESEEELDSTGFAPDLVAAGSAVTCGTFVVL